MALEPSAPPSDVTFEEDGSAIVELDPNAMTGEEPQGLPEQFDENLALFLGEEEQEKIAETVLKGYEADKESRDGWEKIILAGLELLGTEVTEKADSDWQCDVVHPLIIENACKFQAKAIQELWPASGPLKTQIIGAETDEKQAKALRVKKYMNYQVDSIMEEYYDDTEKILFNTALLGTSVRKVYFDEVLGRPVGEQIPVNRFFVNYSAPDIRRANRHTELMDFSEDDFNKLMAAGFYMDIELDGPEELEIDPIQEKTGKLIGQEYVQDSNEGYQVLEQHVNLTIEGDPLLPMWGSAPYVISVHLASRKLLSIRRNWAQQDPKCKKLEWYIMRNFVPGFYGPYGLGLIHLLGQITQTTSASIRALIDSGNLANLPAGIKNKKLKMAGDKNEPFAPGEWRDAEVPMDARLMDMLMPMPYKEPSQTLFQLVQFMLGAGQKFADSQDQVISDSTNYGPVGTTMSLLEASAKFYSSIHKRMHRAQRNEFRILARLNASNLPDKLTVPISGELLQIAASDFNGTEVDVLPVSDPNTPSQAQRATLAQAIIGMANQAPSLHNMREVYARFYRTLGIEDVDKLMPKPNEPQPKEPLEDILAAMQGEPIKAFPGQRHDAHIGVKQSFIELPENQVPSMRPFLSALQANIREHQVLKFGELIMALAQERGIPMQEAQGELAKQVVQLSLAEARSEANRALARDPVLQLEARDMEAREDKIKTDLVIAAGKQALAQRELDLKAKDLSLKASQAVTNSTIQLEDMKHKDARARENNAIKLVGIEAQKAAKDD